MRYGRTGIDFTCEHPVDLILGRRLILVGIPGIEYGGPFGIACEVVTENVLHDSACPGILLKMLINIFISEWNRSIEMFLIALLMLEHNLNTLRSAVRLILRHSKHDIDLELAVGSGSIIILKYGLPVTVMFLKDGLDIVVVLDIAEPPV
ncbi:hypothetical protein IMSAGC020_00239 [Lachnospiraceae bacterium]|nr:hypothetical protein IMSAGC020_00239 [Lachnospiraceae bacterium]